MPTRWFVANGDEVTIGDAVALEFHPDEVGVIAGVNGDYGLPMVEVVEGPFRGKVRPAVYPGQILMLLKKGGLDNCVGA